jgi:hypothetical protein
LLTFASQSRPQHPHSEHRRAVQGGERQDHKVLRGVGEELVLHRGALGAVLLYPPGALEVMCNIKDVYLLKVTDGTQKEKIEFSWDRGWYETSI